jgi:LPS O-antigen subunit length determinant protein (WzzB/FepE family)
MEHQERSRDEIDLVQLVKVLIKRKWVIIGGTIIITLLAVIISLLLPKVYKSEGFFQLGRGIDVDLEELREIQDEIRKDFQEKMVDHQTIQDNLLLLLNETLRDTELVNMNVSIPDYKKYVSRFSNLHQFLQFVKKKIKNKEPGDLSLADIRQNLGTSEELRLWIEPEYAYSKKELKDLAQNMRDFKNFVLGVQIIGEQTTPENARAVVAVLGEFIKDSILYGKLREYIGNQLNKSKTKAKKYDNLIINDELKLRQLTMKRSHMEELLKKYPQAKAMQNRELFSIPGSGERYLPPLAQIVGIESHIADIKENLAQNQRKKQAADLKLLFFLEIKKRLTADKFGEPLLTKCIKLTDTFFDKEDVPGNVIREVRNDLAVDFDNIAAFKDVMRFISGPTLSRNAIRPKKVLITAVGFVLGLFLSIFFAFFVDWWIINKKRIMSEKPGNKNER